ncbi:flagellar biosynthesis protein FlhA [Desulfothermobacter acidiphilus]|uniref:flagellar biosynthesis protein FlhA n=1 Tax=Desulfothermobacter acidiphilus TaxID=1938353 RepID=UPI003F88681B
MRSSIYAAAERVFSRYGDLLVAGMVVGLVLLIIVPLPPVVLDLLLLSNLALSMVILLVTLFTVEPLQFSVFPTVLLVLTLFRLALEVAATRLILGQASAGAVIHAFGSFVVGGSYVVGFVIFLIITVVQFVVITNGANRVAEVAARFCLDSLPGKQMAIDGDFNSGLITEAEARERRRRLQREADFFGAMDGAAKFVRGDAIASLVVILINILGGFVVGVAIRGMEFTTALRTYTLLTIGEGLVTQIPALLVSTSAGVLVTRSGAEAAFGQELPRQLAAFSRLLFVAAAIFLLLALAPGLPHLLLLGIGGVTGALGYFLEEERKRRVPAKPAEPPREKRVEPENVLTYFQVEPLEIELGYGLVPLAQEEQGGDLLARVAAVRRQSAAELGLYVRPVRIRDNLQLPPNVYIFRLRGVEAGRGELLPGYLLAVSPMGEAQLDGIATKEPVFGLPAWWIPPSDKAKAEALGFTVVEPSAVLATHLAEFIKQNAAQLLGRQEVRELLDAVKERYPALVEELVPGLLGLGEVQKVLQGLLEERVPVRDLVSILEALADAAPLSRDPDFLLEQARAAMARVITQQYAREGKLAVLTLHPRWEERLFQAKEEGKVLDPKELQRLLEKVGQAVEGALRRGLPPVILCAPGARLLLRRLVAPKFPQVAVISYREVWPQVAVEAVGTVDWNAG